MLWNNKNNNNNYDNSSNNLANIALGLLLPVPVSHVVKCL
jgi:hypothetical protein